MVQVSINLNVLGSDNQIYPLRCSLPIALVGFRKHHILPSFASLYRPGDWGLVYGPPPERWIIIFNDKYRWSMMFYSLGSTIDLTIAFSLCYFLTKHRKTSIKRWVLSTDSFGASG